MLKLERCFKGLSDFEPQGTRTVPDHIPLHELHLRCVLILGNMSGAGGAGAGGAGAGRARRGAGPRLGPSRPPTTH